jgi:sporulation protein YlmC with PRC-barrel domain
MMKKMMLGAAVSALLVSGALAQTPAPSSNSNPPPAAATKPVPPAAAQNNKGSGEPQFVASQQPDQFLASNFKGTDVLGTDDKKIGDVSDILFDKDGKIEAYVISIGGFLGMGAKEVALAPSSFEVVPAKNGGAKQLKLSMSKDQLKQAENFTPYSPPKPAATTGSGGLGSPTGGGMKPPAGTAR